ncbi:hypothetical protein BH18ACT15_BH18ACT15_09010 [soil metagenome]
MFGPEILILGLAWLAPLAVVVYGLVLAGRLVRAVERIAIESMRRRGESPLLPTDERRRGTLG